MSSSFAGDAPVIDPAIFLRDCSRLVVADLFNSGLIHEVPSVIGDDPRIVLATFIGYSQDDEEVMVWA